MSGISDFALLWATNALYLKKKTKKKKTYLWGSLESHIVCESILLWAVQKKDGLPFCYLHTGLWGLRLSLKRIKWYPLSMQQLCSFVWEMLREKIGAAMVSRFHQGSRAVLALGVMKVTAWFNMVDLLDGASPSRHIFFLVVISGATIDTKRCCPFARPARKAQSSPQRRQSKSANILHWVTMTTTG